MSDSLDLPISKIADDVRSGTLCAADLCRDSLARIAAGADLNAVLTASATSSTAAAELIDKRRSQGEGLGKLAGVPIAVKDALCTIDAPTTSASKILTRVDASGVAGSTPEHGWRPPYDATVVARLRAADAIIIGKTNMDEFAMGSSNENSAFGSVKNPWDPARIPGGSSGGSAVSVAARLAPGALGSDTGGSIRQPAALCGVVGVKPSYGRVSRFGLVAFASSLDQVGPMTPDVRSSARLLEVIAGHDPADSTSSRLPVGNYEAACDQDVSGLKLGMPAEYFADGIRDDVKACVLASIDRLKDAGASVVPVDMPHTRYGVGTYYVVATAEASANLARFDGVRFGLRVEAPKSDLEQMYQATRQAGFGPEVKRRIMLGTYVLSAGYYDAYYIKAQKVRTLIARDFDRAFEKVDALVTPVTPHAAFRFGARSTDPLAMYMEDVYTLPASLAGVCGISVPCGTVTPDDGDRPMPIGLQILAPAFEEERMFRLAAGAEATSSFLGSLPPSN
ncbi:MAG: Asp-tRNA(Asn)/Glu-tRNA(Gln) amidotransferase subunit GatA [Polyangiaceae bacterium]|nr:Asp-tRNA(Asn)/Glu-tRNA(Gln) amidotransferase subunit GatA [Polyangiaceae bacterium]